MKLIFLGDSLTWGGYGGNFVAEIQQRLPQQHIVNAGEGGNTIVNLLRRCDDLLALEPDGVFVMTGGNEAIANLYPATRPYYAQAQGIPGGMVSPEQFAQTYRDLLAQLQVQHVLTWVGLPPLEYSRDLVQMLQTYHTLAQEAAQSFNIPVLDLLDAFLPASVMDRPPLTLKDIRRIGERTGSGWSDYEGDRAAGGFTFTFDGLHLMPASARQMADRIVDFLNFSA